MIIVDRIENGIAVCEIDGVMRDIPLSGIRGDVREGDVLVESGKGSYLVADKAATEQRKAAITERFERLKRRERKP
ncbi:MAG: DUF3006 domain-containing protein [Clostridiales bacterium]|nr:DUF3006 domain-containing protein [Clostridiales bacterium]